MEKLSLKNFQSLTIYFIIYSFIGWVMESSYALYYTRHFVNRGFLFGPLCPLYGYGAIILILFFKNYKKHSLKLFFYASFIFSVFEYITSYVLDALFKLKWWDYTNDFLNINGRVSLFYSVIWGIAAILFLNHVHPFISKKVDKLIDKISDKYKIILVSIFIVLLISDTTLSSLHVLKII